MFVWDVDQDNSMKAKEVYTLFAFERYKQKKILHF